MAKRHQSLVNVEVQVINDKTIKSDKKGPNSSNLQFDDLAVTIPEVKSKTDKKLKGIKISAIQ